MSALVMGVLNVTPDSFSDGGRWFSRDAAVAHGMQLISEGADVVDIGGESTRPGAHAVDAEEEMARVIPVVRALSPYVRISIDTMKPEVARAAVEAGASLINDVSATLADVAAAEGAGWIAMHMHGSPKTMQSNPTYTNVVADVSRYLFDKADYAKSLGIAEVWIDPGIGFGKTVDHNLSLLAHIDNLTLSGYPVAIGTSRKSFLGKVLGDGTTILPVEDRVGASLATAAWAVAHGVSMLRVHDVQETKRAVRIISAVQEAA